MNNKEINRKGEIRGKRERERERDEERERERVEEGETERELRKLIATRM